MSNSIARLLSLSLILGASTVVAQQPQPTPTPPKKIEGSSSGGTSSSSSTGTNGSSSTSTSSGGTSSTGSSSGGSGTATMKVEPGSLEDLLDKALRHNPDIIAAAAKVTESESLLNQVRHQVVAKVVRLRSDLDLAKKMLEYSERTLRRVEQQVKNAVVAREDLEIATADVEKKRTELAKLEGDLQALIGSWKTSANASVAFSPDGRLIYSSSIDGSVRVWNALTGAQASTYSSSTATSTSTSSFNVQAPMAERIRTALNKVVNLKEDQGRELPLAEMLKYFSEKAAIDVPFRTIGKFDNASVSLMKAELPVGAWLQVMEDSAPNVRFVVREYGILVTTRAGVPEGALTVQEFWMRGDKAKPTTADAKTTPVRP
jgi:hypothetical protein